MAYPLTAEKRGKQNLPLLHESLARYGLIEFFPIEISEDAVMLGISIPFKVTDDPRLETEVVDLMTYLVEQGFQVTDLYTGKPLGAEDISDLAQKISG